MHPGKQSSTLVFGRNEFSVANFSKFRKPASYLLSIWTTSRII